MDLSPSDPWGLRDYVKLENMLNPPEVSNGGVISERFFHFDPILKQINEITSLNFSLFQCLKFSAC